MGLVDFILNLAGLLLWLNWRALRIDPLGKRTPATLIGTLRRAEPQRLRHWHLLAAIGGLLLVRAGFYWQIGLVSKPVWAGTLDLGIIAPSFLSNSFGRMCLFSICSFGLVLAVFYLWLLLLSILAGPEPVHGLVRMQLGAMDRWPRRMKLFLPLMAAALLWWLASWLLEWHGIIPKPISTAHRIEQSLLIGLGSYLVWKYVIGVLLALHLLNNYVYFGRHPFWNYVNATARTLLQPLRRVPLRAGKADFAPVVGIVLVFLLAGLAERGLIFIYGRLSY
ncbi:MAG: hypothetical protein ABSC01_11020 [Verrucomicrobiota bacterium]|jgi:uncharacterized protein YggT (Ycf19 family)